MRSVHTLAVAAGFATMTVVGAAQAAPVTFAQVTDTNTANGLAWTNNGDGTATLNTDVSTGDLVNFTFENLVGTPSYLSGQLSAIETINGGAGATTSAAAQQASVFGTTYDSQAINAPMTISYKLAGAAAGSNNLLTITIVPNVTGGSGLVLTGADGGTGAAATASNTSNPPPSYTETFSSDFLKFTSTATITAGFSFSALIPEFTLGASGLLDSFGADVVSTFSSNPPPSFVSEPASLALLGIGVAGLAMVARRFFV